MHDRLNRLAGRGTPRGFDAVLDAAAEEARRESTGRISAVPDLDDEDERGDLDTIPFVTTEPIRRRRRPLSSMIAAAGIAALLLVGTFAVSALVGSGGGAGSAEGAVQRLADALAHEDPLAAADVLAPSEVRSLHGTLDQAAHKAKELQLVETAGAPLAGVDFDVANLKLSSQSLADGYAKVTVDEGTFSASTHKAKFSTLMQKVLRDASDNSTQSDLAQLAASQDLPTFVVVVREDGRWYVSAAYTVLEYVREAQQLPAADFGSGLRSVKTLGADSPDAAVQDSMRALQAEDWSKLMTMVSPNEIPFYDYRAAFSALIAQSGSESKSSCRGASQCLSGPGAPPQKSSGFTIGAMSTTAQIDGDTAKVSLTASGTTSSGKWSLNGGCFTTTIDNGDGTRRPYTFSCRDGSPFLLGGLGLFLGGAQSDSQFTVVQHSGRWFVSPVGTVLDVVDHTIAQLDRRTVYSALNVPNEIPIDGQLTLGTPVTLGPALADGLKVLSFDGHRGESLLGLATAKPAPGAKPTGADNTDSSVPAHARVFGPDGTEISDAGGMISGHAVALPTDGEYRIVLQMQVDPSFVGGTVTVTIWNAPDAPADARVDRGSESCTYTLFGSYCDAMSGTAVPVAPANVPGSGETCTSTAEMQQCTGTSFSSGGVSGSTISGGTVTPSTVLVPTNPPSTVAGSSGSQNASATSSVPHG